jgi:hypothetical protein
MKRVLCLALLACAAVCTLHAQAVDVNVCDVLKNPKNFDGKLVRIKGVVFSGFDSFIVKDASGDCGFPVDSLWLEYPQGTKAKAGATTVLRIEPAHNFAGSVTATTRTPVVLDAKSKDFKQFDSLLAQPHKSDAICLGCARYEVAATLTGRIDAVADANLKRDAAGKIVGFGGFGNLNMYPARLVLQSVADVAPKDLDYSTADAAVKKQPPTPAAVLDPIESAKKIVDSLNGTPAGAAAQKLYAALPKKGEHNGVNILKGNTSEEKSEAQGKEDSPDGVLFTVTANNDKLQGAAYVAALFHVGQRIADLRQSTADAEPPFIVEYNAWSMAITSAVMSGQKTLTLSGGPLVWDLSWPQADRNGKMNEAITNYLNKFAAINR